MAALLAETVALADSNESLPIPDAAGDLDEDEVSWLVEEVPHESDDATDVAEDAPPPEPSEAPVSLDIDVEDEDDRERLIAEAIAFAEADESGSTPAEPATLLEERDTTDRTETDPSPSVTFPTQPGVVPAPTIGADALVALSAMNRQGVTLPDEVILDLGEATTPEDRDRLLAAALAHVEMQDAVYRVTGAKDRQSSRWKGAAAALLFVIAMTLAIQPPAWVTPGAPASLSATDRLEGVRLTLLLQVQQIEAYRAREGRLPDSLSEVAITLPDVRFVRSNNRVYQLVAYAPNGEPVLYDSAAPATWFRDLTARWITTSAGS